MGYIKHNAIIVTSSFREHIDRARAEAVKIFDDAFAHEPLGVVVSTAMISPIQSGVTNEYYSFFIAPDGSKEGWDTSESGDNARALFHAWLKSNRDVWCNCVEVRYGGDDGETKIVRWKR